MRVVSALTATIKLLIPLAHPLPQGISLLFMHELMIIMRHKISPPPSSSHAHITLLNAISPSGSSPIYFVLKASAQWTNHLAHHPSDLLHNSLNSRIVMIDSRSLRLPMKLTTTLPLSPTYKALGGKHFILLSSTLELEAPCITPPLISLKSLKSHPPKLKLLWKIFPLIPSNILHVSSSINTNLEYWKALIPFD